MTHHNGSDEGRVSEWRDNREPGWYEDVGYALQDVVRAHRYDIGDKGSKPDDPGWHVCSCGKWEGYWSGFEPHVADHLRPLAARAAAPDALREHRVLHDTGTELVCACGVHLSNYGITRSTVALFAQHVRHERAALAERPTDGAGT